ncbi:MAG: SDR family oxidoreductase [Leptospiraceae bacterium]|nr:SDR family oxidoreductase [Leptospiraceae bacterium]
MSLKKILITGASSGFGKIAAQTLALNGYIVFATMRNIKGSNAQYANELELWAKDNRVELRVLELDVTSDESIASAKENVLNSTNGSIDVVINNAGIFSGGLIESFTIDDYKKIYEVNVFGAVRVANAFLPVLRQQKAGLLIQVSSVLGRVVIPFGGVYDSSKFALEAISESLYYELKPLGVDVSIIEPGPFSTELIQKVLQPSNQVVATEYGVTAKLMGSYYENYTQQMQDPNLPNKPQDVADHILKLVETPNGKRPLRVVVDKVTGGVAEVINETASKVQESILRDFGLSELIINVEN